MANKNTQTINLETVHRQMRAKYLVTSELEQDKKQAREIQRVLRKIAREYNKNSDDLIANEAYRLIVENIRQQHPRLKNLFQAKSGTDFEKRMYYIMEGIVNTAVDVTGHAPIDTSSIWTAKQMGNTFDLSDFTNELAQQVLRESGVKTEKYLQGKDKGKSLYLKNIYRKSDIAMVNIQITGNETNEVLRIYNLLKGATFSLKNYDTNLSQYAKDWWTKGLKLGGASFARSVGSSLKSLGYNTDAIFKLLAANQKLYATDKNIQNHFDHLAFIYELTGAGMRLENNKLEFAKFFIFNDPSGELVVRSSRELLKRMFDTQMLISESIKGKKYYTIRKSIFS